jgi:EAL domain-containing protein (putative c-di-GMP-specific phosphodiesterase class I)
MWSILRGMFASGDGGEPVFVVGDAARLETVSAALPPLGLKPQHFNDVAAMLDAAKARNPALVFIDLSLGVAAAGQAVGTLSTLPKRGAVQLVSPIEIETYEQVGAVGQLRIFGDQKGVKMLPAMQPPYKAEAVKKVITELGLRRDAAGKPKVTLAQAIQKNWLELWYQPKIDLATKRLYGAEGLIRVQHPKHGTLFPGSFLPGAGEDDMLRMTESVIITALRDWEDFAGQGVSVKLAVNTPVSALTKLKLADILRREKPKAPSWPGLILEVTEDEIVNDIQLANDVAAELRAHHCSLAIDDFGAGYSSLARLRQLPFSELKIDRSYVTDCNVDRTNAGLCEVIIELARRFGLKTVAEGIETVHESHKLQSMGCDIGQGYLFSKPLDKAKFISLLRRRIVTKAQPMTRRTPLQANITGLLSEAKS